MMTFDEYMALEGLNCPKCESTSIHARLPEADGALVYRENYCTECGAEWVEYFDVVEIEMIEEM